MSDLIYFPGLGLMEGKPRPMSGVYVSILPRPMSAPPNQRRPLTAQTKLSEFGQTLPRSRGATSAKLKTVVSKPQNLAFFNVYRDSYSRKEKRRKERETERAESRSKDMRKIAEFVSRRTSLLTKRDIERFLQSEEPRKQTPNKGRPFIRTEVVGYVDFAKTNQSGFKDSEVAEPHEIN